MGQTTTFIFAALLVSHVYSAPQFITFKDGAIGVNFAGYHASAGLGGILGGGTGGGLFASAGTPYGQSAGAGLGGAVDKSGQTAGGLYAGATAGGNVKAHAGLGGGVTGEKAAGSGFAEAQAGNRYAASGLGGEKSVEGSSGFTFSGSKSFGVSGGFVKEAELAAPVVVETVKPVVHKTVHKEVNLEAANEVKPLPLVPVKAEFAADVNVKAEAPATVIVKEVEYYPPPPPPPPPVHVIEKQIYRVRTKPHHHFRKTAFVGGYIGAGGDVPPPPPPPPVVVYKPVVEKRIDVAAESAVDTGAAAHADVGGGGQYTLRKRINFQSNPNFFRDIFNIPISTLNAVGNFLGNAAAGTSVSVQKSAAVHADSESLSPKHAPSSTSSISSSGETHVSIQTPTVSKVIEDIFAIPINTLGAVNKFLENNVGTRKTVEISGTEDVEPARVRLGPHARRRANKRVVVVQENNDQVKAEVPPANIAEPQKS
ncbi:probable RNA methyltransferase bin3 [Hyposmocoma kahamanoa]|uniref:probable RNA methyltransferase bin3 n=1 Tax=Hyposmocoma kahamanoa TaxID=1477025 RepID=UPI000E6D744A|nr:probable RNA methyltransferase bin3 [Hyposmocoma kahamanoa]